MIILSLPRSGLITILAVYVDDLLLTGSDSSEIDDLKTFLHATFSIKDLGSLHYFLGLEINHIASGIAMAQHKFTIELLSSCAINFPKCSPTPLPIHLKLNDTDGDLLTDPTKYRVLIGKLNYLTHTRPDLSFAVRTLSQFMQNPRIPHFEALKHTLSYVQRTAGNGILLNCYDKPVLQAFSDSDWAACPMTRRSVTGYIILLGSSPISWKSKKQAIVSRSSAEAEYRAMAQAATEITWLVRLLQELQVEPIKPITLYCDNHSAMHIARNPVFHERTKHIEVDCHFTRDKVMEGLLHLAYIPSSKQLADVFTKILSSHQQNHILSKLGLHQSPA